MPRIPTKQITVDGKTKIVNADDPRANEPVITPETIAAMPKADVVEHLKAHGVDAPKGKVSELREALRNVAFLDI